MSAQRYTFFHIPSALKQFFFLTYENHFIPDISAHYNFLVINIIHFVIDVSVQNDFFIVTRKFGHAGTDRRVHNHVIFLSRGVKCAIIVVISHISIDDHHRAPSAEDGVSYDSSDRRAADDIVSVDVAAVNAVVEVVGNAVIVNGTDTVRNVHVVTKGVVVRVYVRRSKRSVVSGCRFCVRTGSCSLTRRTTAFIA